MYIPGIIPETDIEATYGKYREKTTLSSPDLGTNPVLLIVDMTDGFVLDSYRTGFSRTGIPCAESIHVLLNLFREKGLKVVFTRDMTGDDLQYRLYRGAWNNKSNPTPEADRPGHNHIYSALTPVKGEIVLEKSKPSAFFGTSLVSILNYFKATSVIVTGMVTSGCIRATVVDAFSYNYRVFIPVECVADRSQISHEVTLFDLDLKYAYVLPEKQIVSSLQI